MSDADTIREYLVWAKRIAPDGLIEKYDALVAERDEARRERDKALLSVEGLSKRLTIAVAAEARVTELEADVRMAMQAHADEEADNERLREALEDLNDYAARMPGYSIHPLTVRARAALANEETP